MNGGMRWMTAGVAAAALTSLGVGAQEPAKVAFSSGRGAEGQLNIYLMNEDGSNVKAVTEGAGFAFDPALSPDGKRIAYAFGRTREARMAEIYVMNADGSGKTQLSQLAGISMFPRWSPDGKRLAFTTASGFDAGGPPQMKLHVMDADGKNHAELAEGWASGWTPDGKRLVYTLMQANGEQFSVQTVEPTGANPQPLLPSKSALAAFSPDGKKLAYIAEGGGDQPDLFVADADGKNPVQLTRTEDMELAIHWAADGKRIFFNRLSKNPPGESLAKTEIHAISVDGKTQEQLTTNDVADALPSGILVILGARQ